MHTTEPSNRLDRQSSRRTRPLVAAGVLASAMALSGCALAPTPEPEPTVALYPVVEAPAPTIPNSGMIVGGGINGFVSASGYTFDVTFAVRTNEVTISIGNASPGYVDLSWSWDAEVLVKNTTEGRNAPAVEARAIGILMLWASDSVVCQTSFDTPFLIGASQVLDDAGCYLSSGQDLWDDGIVAPGDYVGTNQSSIVSTTVDEDELEPLRAALNAGPDEILLLAAGGPGHCPPKGLVVWGSGAHQGCAVAGAYINQFDTSPVDVQSALAITRSIPADEPGLSEAPCPLSVIPTDLNAGLALGGVTEGDWQTVTFGFPDDYVGGFAPTSSFKCGRSGFWVALTDVSDVEDIPVLLSNAGSRPWQDVSAPLEFRGGLLYFTQAQEDSYVRTQYAWVKDGLMVSGSIFDTPPDRVYAWLGMHLSALVQAR